LRAPYIFKKEEVPSGIYVIDTEMGDYKDNSKAAISLAVLNLQGDVVFNQVFQPEEKIERSQIPIHGISQNEISSAPELSKVRSEIEEFLHDKVVIGYALKNDILVIQFFFFNLRKKGVRKRWFELQMWVGN